MDEITKQIIAAIEAKIAECEKQKINQSDTVDIALLIGKVSGLMDAQNIILQIILKRI